MKSDVREHYETQFKYFHCTALYSHAVTLGVENIYVMILLNTRSV